MLRVRAAAVDGDSTNRDCWCSGYEQQLLTVTVPTGTVGAQGTSIAVSGDCTNRDC